MEGFEFAIFPSLAFIASIVCCFAPFRPPKKIKFRFQGKLKGKIKGKLFSFLWYP
jgi:hypothetical protein